MGNFAFAFVVDGFDIEVDAELDALYQKFEDFSASRTAGKTKLSFVIEAQNAIAALNWTVDQLRDILPNVRVRYLDDDLVGGPDIAARTSRTPESIRLLANGARGSGGFPNPVGVLRGGMKIWKWAEVCQWFKNRGQDYSNSSEFIDWDSAAVFHALLAHRYVDRDTTFGQREYFDDQVTGVSVWCLSYAQSIQDAVTRIEHRESLTSSGL